MAEIASLGFKTIINNRPDGEEAGQPLGVFPELKAAAEVAGLTYAFIPMTMPTYHRSWSRSITQRLKPRMGRFLRFAEAVPAQQFCGR